MQSWRRDLNPQPADYKSAALPIELRQQDANAQRAFAPMRGARVLMKRTRPCQAIPPQYRYPTEQFVVFCVKCRYSASVRIDYFEQKTATYASAIEDAFYPGARQSWE